MNNEKEKEEEEHIDLTHLDLFSGIGGFALAAKWAGFRTVGFCEIDKYCQRVLAKNFSTDAAGERWGKGRPESNGTRQAVTCRNNIPIFTDIRALDGKQFAGVSLITGGFPCQPFSCAGKRRGTADDRHLWPEMLRVIAEARPAWVLGENVAGIINMELDPVLSQLEAIGYATRPFVIPACGVDARHRRNRVWIAANRSIDGSAPGFPESEQWEEGQSEVAHNGCSREDVENSARVQQGWNIERPERQRTRPTGQSTNVPDSSRERRGTGLCQSRSQQNGNGVAGGCRWQPEPDVGGRIDGLSAELDEIRLKLESHKLIMAYAKNSESVARETLRSLRDFVSKEDVQWAFGGCSGVSPKEVLLTYLRELEENKINEARIQLESSETSRASLRGVRSNDKPSRAPRSRNQQQRPEEHPDSLQALSRLLAQHSQEAWQIDRWQNAETVLSPWGEGWEVGQTRVAHGIPARVDRLRGLGNAIVPQVAYQILNAIAQQIITATAARCQR